MRDTIFALSSGSPPAAIAIMRLSGPAAFEAGEALVAGKLPAPRKAAVRTLRDADCLILDRALVLVFEAGMSATGEDVVEFHLHGGRAVVAALDKALVAFHGLRRAEAGEFTRRALLSGRIDLSEAEGLADLLEAETETARRAAVAASGGAIRRLTEGWTDRLLAISARLEAALDHADEADVETSNAGNGVGRDCADLAGDMDRMLARPEVERLHEGIKVVLAGRPNAGKSTLLNHMVEREAAIVSPIAGTTRDRIDVAVQHGGKAYVFSDTAGLAEQSDDPIEAIGIERAHRAIDEADILLWLDDDEPPARAAERVLPIFARADCRPALSNAARLPVSAVTGEGIDELWRRIDARAEKLLPRLDEAVLNRRQRGLLFKARDELQAAAGVCDPLLVAEHLRAARVLLDRITGRADVEAVLDGVFSRFCIGK